MPLTLEQYNKLKGNKPKEKKSEPERTCDICSQGFFTTQVRADRKLFNHLRLYHLMKREKASKIAWGAFKIVKAVWVKVA